MTKTVFYLRTDLGTEHLVAGGSVAHTIGVVTGLKNQGYRIVAASSAMIEKMNTLPLHELLPLRLGRWCRSVGFKISCIFSNIVFTISCARLCRTYSFDFIYQRYSLLNSVGVVLGWWYGLPLVLEFNGSEVWVDEHWSKRRWLKIRFLVAWCERINLRYARTIVVVSHVLKENLIAQGVCAEKIMVHPNGVDVDYFDPAVVENERHVMRSGLTISDKKVCGFIGTFSYWHGIEILAQLIPEAVERWPHLHFLLIGDGPLHPFLYDEISKKGLLSYVTFVGTVAQEQARTYLATCDMFILPTYPNIDGTRFFGSPTKLFEYMSLGKPIIASDIEQVAQVLCPALHAHQNSDMSSFAGNEVGILVAPGDIMGFVTAIGMIMSDESGCVQRLGYNARHHVVNHYTWHHHIEALINHISTQ